MSGESQNSTDQKVDKLAQLSRAHKIIQEELEEYVPDWLSELWNQYWVEICLVVGIIWLGVLLVGFVVRRKYQEINRKRKLAMEKGDTKAQDTKIHEMMEESIRQTLGPGMADRFKRLTKYVMYSKNPIGIILYCMMQCLGYTYSYVYLIDRYCPGPYLGENHKPISLVFVLFCWSTYFYVLGLRPRTTKEKMKMWAIDEKYKSKEVMQGKYQDFVYDGVFYVKGAECKTCKIPKLARSKHCSICDECFDYFDHHCIWVNACVTRSNLKGFILFVFSHACLCLYGSYVFVMVLFGEVVKVNDTTFSQFLDWQNGFNLFYQYVWDFISEVWRFGTSNWLLAGLGCTCLALGLTLPIFFGFHVSLVLKNRTTNEHVKKSKLQFGLNNQYIFFRAIIGKTEKLVKEWWEKKELENNGGVAAKKEDGDGVEASGEKAEADATKEADKAKPESDKKDEIKSEKDKKDEDKTASQEAENQTTASAKVGEDDSSAPKVKQQPKEVKKARPQVPMSSAIEGGVPLPRFKLDNVEIPLDPDARVEFFVKKIEEVEMKMRILNGSESPYEPRTLKEAWQFVIA